MSKSTYLRRKEMGLCVKCGSEIESERKGKTTCYSCMKKNTEYKRESMDFVRAFKICPRCMKNKLYGDERNCLECRTKNYINREKQRRDYPEREKLYGQHAREKRLARYQQRKQQQLCVTCGKPLREDEYHFSSCNLCRGKKRAKQILSVSPWKRDKIGELA